MKLLIIVNIAAGFGDGSVYDYLRMVCEDGDEHALRCTDGTTDVTSLVQDAEDFDAVVVAGGDGTIAAVTYALANTGIPVLPFPSGTANLLANNLFSPYEPHALARMTREMETLDFDLGEIEADGKRFGFGIMAGAGYDATIIEVQDCAEIDLMYFNTFVPLEFRHVGKPLFVWLVRMKIAIEKVLGHILRILCTPCARVAVVFYR